MTKRAHQRRSGLLAPRRPKRGRADDSDYGRHVLDSTRSELHPPTRRAVMVSATEIRAGVPADDPFMHPDKSEAFRILRSIVDVAEAEGDELVENAMWELCEAAGLTVAELEAVVMHADGLPFDAIGKLQHVSADAARAAHRRGVHKMRKFISISGQAASSPGLIGGHFGDDEA